MNSEAQVTGPTGPSPGLSERSRKEWMAIGAVVLLALVAGSTILSVNLFPVLTNDSLTYVRYSGDFADFGWVHVGYRQFGYPLFLWITRSLSGGLVSIEPLLFAVFVQRLLLILGVGYAAWLWRWWSLPIVILAITSEVLSYSNLILTEGVTVPLALILIGATGHFISLAKSPNPSDSRRAALAIGGLAALIALSLVAIRFPFAVFGISPLVIAVAARDTPLRRGAWVLFGLYLVGASLIVGLISFENRVEYGEFSPSTRGARSEYWAVWTTTFRLEPSNASDPDLADSYGTGDPYDFMSKVDSLDIPYSEQAAIYEQATEQMLVDSGSGVWGSRARAFIGALMGGRINDLEGVIEQVEQSDRWNVDEVIHSNVYSREKGPDAFADEFNGGELPEAVITAPLAERLPLPTALLLIQILLPTSLIVCCVALWNPGSRLVAIAGLAAVIAHAVLIGYIRADNFRFLLTTSVFGIGAALGALSMWKPPKPTYEVSPADSLVK